MQGEILGGERQSPVPASPIYGPVMTSCLDIIIIGTAVAAESQCRVVHTADSHNSYSLLVLTSVSCQCVSVLLYVQLLVYWSCDVLVQVVWTFSWHWLTL